MAYENRAVQSATTYTLPNGTDPLVDNTASGDVQAVKILDGTAGSTTPILAGGGVEADALRVTIASDSTGVLSVDDNGSSLTVDGTVAISGTVTVGSHAVTNAGTFAVQVDGTALTRLTDIETNTDSGAVVGNGAAATAQRVTIANDSTGTVTATVTGSVTANAGTNLNTSALALESGGNLAGAATSLAILDDWDESDRAKVNPIVGQAGVAAGAGAVGVTVQRVTLASDDPAVTALQILDNAISGNEMQVDVVTLPALAAGTNNIGDVDILSIAAGDNNIGNVDIVTVPAPLSTTGGGTEATALRVTVASDSTGVLSVDDNGGALTVDNGGTFAVQPGPATSGGLTIFRSIDLDESEEEVKASAGQVYGWAVTNTATSTRWLKFYNATAANVTVGTTTPVITWGVPGNTSDDISANVMGAMGIEFSTAITVAATTGVADADTGAPGANEVIVNIFYK